MPVEALVVPLICAPVANQIINDVQRSYPLLNGVDLADNSDLSTSLEIDIMVGADYYWKFVTGKTTNISEDLRVVETKLGWVLNGSVRRDVVQHHSVNSVNTMATHVLIAGAEPPVASQFERFWEIEGCDDQEETFDATAFKDRIQFNGERYSVPLPFKPGMRDRLPLNFGISKKRLDSLTRKLLVDPEKFKRYDEVIRKQEVEGKIERVVDSPPRGEAHYLPHHGVVREDKETTKLRVVNDASSGKPSLNDCLEKGENLVPLMFDVLLRSRTYRIALIGDIKEAFLNVSVDEEYRDFLRFLWYESIDDLKPVTYRFTRVIFGMNASLWLLVIVIQKHLEQYAGTDPDLVAYVLRSLFVDDNIGGAEDTTEAFQLYRRLKEVFLAAGLDLRKWCTNDVELQVKINECERLRNGDGMKIEVKSSSKVLGIPWSVANGDEYHIATHAIYLQAMDIVISQREIARIIGMIFDLLGVIAPIVVSFKVFFQKVTQLKGRWDDVLPPEFQLEWVKLVEMLRDDSLFRVKRYHFGSRKLKDFQKFTIHGFSDSSDVAYAAVVYIVAEMANGIKVSDFVTAKTKVAPVKKVSTPRLELCGCLLLSTLLTNVDRALEGVVSVAEKVCWSDSVDALCWVKNEKKHRKPFVENRAKKIRKVAPPEWWRHVPTDINPADIASRGVKTPRSVTKEIRKFIDGPGLLQQNPIEWPDDLSKDALSSNPDPEEEQVTVNCTFEANMEVICLFVQDEATGKPTQKVKVFEERRPKLTEIVTVDDFSCVWKLFRVTGWVRRFVGNYRRKIRGEPLITGFLSMQELKEAEIMWIISVQRGLEDQSKQLNNTLGLYVDEDNVLRCKGRLQNAELTVHQKNPILIPGNAPFAKLLVVDAHRRTAHGGKKDTIVQLRSKYWVTKARNLVRHMLHSCPRPCRRLEGKAFKSAEAAQLPSFRVQQSFPFTNTGVDYLGPVLVRQVYDDKRTEMHKTWVVLYTCAVTRAVHLDMVPDLSASAFIRSLKRFIGRRGVPNLMISDSATCFKNEEVKLNEELLRLQVKWRFIVEASPWWGGFWERLVQTVKRSLRKVLFRASVNYEELQTVIIDVEGIINSRPLTYLYDDDVEEVLTPSHLLLGRRLLSTFDEPFDDGVDVDSAVITKRMKYLKSLSDHYWKRFRDEYLLELRSQHVQGGDPTRVPEAGEVVVIEGTTKRNDWRLGVITSFITGADNRNRAAVVRTFDGSKTRLIQRPIERLYPIEIKATIPIGDHDPSSVPQAPSEARVDDERPTRRAADEGVLRRRLADMQ